MRTSTPSIAMLPASARYAPASTFIKVDLPAPFSPTSACTSPRLTSNETPSSARTPGNTFTIPLITSNGPKASLLNKLRSSGTCPKAPRQARVRLVWPGAGRMAAQRAPTRSEAPEARERRAAQRRFPMDGESPAVAGPPCVPPPATPRPTTTYLASAAVNVPTGTAIFAGGLVPPKYALMASIVLAPI